MEKIGHKFKNAACLAAVAFSFALYVIAFDPFGVAEAAYVFAVPAIIAARFLMPRKSEEADANSRGTFDGLKNPFALKRQSFKADPFSRAAGEESVENIENDAVRNKKFAALWLLSTFVFSYIAWGAILIWLRHVYPPAGWAAVVFLPLAVSTLFIWPWFAILPWALPNIKYNAGKRLARYLGLAGFWVLLEWLRSWMFTGFPWLLLAHSQWRRPPVMQTAAFGGVWIVSFILIFFNLAMAEYLCRLYTGQKNKLNSMRGQTFSRFTPEFYLALLLAVGGAWYYIMNLPRAENVDDYFRAGMIQTDFAGILKWDDELAIENLETVKKLTLELKNADVDIVAMPEAATPPRFPVIGMPEMKLWIEKLSRDLGEPIIMGNMAYLADQNASQNGVFAVSPDKGLSDKYYAKRKLVPFGEYVPAWAGFLGKIVPVGSMKRGEWNEPLKMEIKGKEYNVGPMICYEDIFPQLGRHMALNGADILYVCTNDSWYGREGGAWQHAAHSAFQAVAARKPLIRASNNGLSTVFDQYGRMRPCTVLRYADGSVWDASSPESSYDIEIENSVGENLDPATLTKKRPSPMLDNKGSIYFRGAGYADVVFYKNFRNGETFYVRYGDWFVVLCAFFTVFAAIKPAADFFKRKKRAKKA